VHEKNDTEQLQLIFMGQGRYTLSSVSDPVYPVSDFRAQFICAACLNCQNIGFIGHLAKIKDNIGLFPKT